MIDKGFFITLEGGEGSGKTSLIQKLEVYLASKGYSVVATREPGGTKFGEHVRSLLLQHGGDVAFSAMAELCLFLSARAQHVEEVIIPALHENRVVLCDRYNDSSIAYQGEGRGLGMEEVEKFCHFASFNVNPNLTLYLDVTPDVGLKRVKEENLFARFELEKMAFHKKVRSAFLELAKKDSNRIFIVDASNTQEEVFLRSKEIIDKFL
jgi:dTMP kinase